MKLSQWQSTLVVSGWKQEKYTFLNDYWFVCELDGEEKKQEAVTSLWAAFHGTCRNKKTDLGAEK